MSAPDPVAEFAAKLVLEFLNPESPFHERQRDGRTGEERKKWERNWAASAHRVFPYPETIWDINCGWCENFAEELHAKFPDGEIVDLDDLFCNDMRVCANVEMTPRKKRIWKHDQSYPAHTVFLYKGKYYDAENPEGIEDWADLECFKFGRGAFSRAEYLRMISATPGSAEAERLQMLRRVTLITAQLPMEFFRDEFAEYFPEGMPGKCEYLVSAYVEPEHRGQGCCGLFMTAWTSSADLFCLTLCLQAYPHEVVGGAQEFEAARQRLERYYARFGFVPASGGWMYRKPIMPLALYA